MSAVALIFFFNRLLLVIIMGNSIGCVRPPQDREHSGAPPLSPKKRLRFRRKHKGKKNRKVELEKDVSAQQRCHDPDEKEEAGEEYEENASVIETPDSDFSSRAQTFITVPGTQLIHSKTTLYSNTLSPGSVSDKVQSQWGSRFLEVSPKPSPAWRGVFCLPGEEDTVSGIIDVSSIPSQTTTIPPVNTIPTVGRSTPGGGRVCRVKEKVQGVLEKPWILQQKEKADKRRVEEMDSSSIGLSMESAVAVTQLLSEQEHKGVVHIREVDGKLCVVRTVYPSDFGSPVWRGESGTVVDVNKEPSEPFPDTGNVVTIHLSDEDTSNAEISFGNFFMPFYQMQIHKTIDAKGFNLDTPVSAQEQASVLESGYASDLLLTSPETTGTSPSQTDWGGMTSSSSERLDSTMESPLTALQQRATVKYLPQVCLFLTAHLSC